MILLENNKWRLLSCRWRRRSQLSAQMATSLRRESQNQVCPDPLHIYVFMAAWCNVEIHNDVDNQQFSSLKFSVWEAVRALSQHDKSVMLPRAVYLDESRLFTSARRRTLLPCTVRPRLACPNCEPDSFLRGKGEVPATASSPAAGGKGTAGVTY